MARFDAVEVGIMWDRLISIADEIVSALVRTSFSTMVRESGDLSCVVFDANGNALAQGSYSVPSFTGTAPPTLRHMLARFPPETLRPGDVVFTNDPWMGTGHLFDVNVMRPVFKDGRIVAYTLSVTHLPDIGGPGFSTVATEIYEEGLRLPICKLVSAGRLDDFLMEIILLNVRYKDMVRGDILANITCNEVGGRLILDFMADYGLETLDDISRALIGQSEAAIRERIRALPDGIYRNSIEVEGIEEPITLSCAIEVKGDAVHADFSGTGPAVRRGINVPLCYTRAYTYYAIKCLTVQEMPNNAGATNPVTLSAPPGCILNPLPPSPTAGRHILGHFVAPLIFGAMAEVAPGMVQADCGMLSQLNFQGLHRDGRKGIAFIYFIAGGYGAMEGYDGLDATPGPSNMIGTPIEVWENLTSVSVLRKQLLPDTGGAGASRGGNGQELEFRNDTGRPLTVSFLSGRTEFAPRGYRGGGDGALRSYTLNGSPAHPKGRFVLAPGDRIVAREAGGAGYGDPRDRPRERVLADIADGSLSPERAMRDYGVSLNA